MAIKFPRISDSFNKLAIRFGVHDDFERYVRDYNGVVQREFDKRTPDNISRKSVILTATDDGSVWEVTIDGTGALTTTKVLG
jgi:hypothetical protein